jgi:hypothetical protein
MLRIRDILVGIRIRGSVPLKLTDQDHPAIFVTDLQDANKKLFFPIYFSLLLFEGIHLLYFSKKKK